VKSVLHHRHSVSQLEGLPITKWGHMARRLADDGQVSLQLSYGRRVDLTLVAGCEMFR